MCDYSLAYFPNRLAVDGERLAVHRFPCGTLGLAAARRSWKQILFPGTTCAVCVPPGARLLLEDIPAHLQREFEIRPCEEVTFGQRTAEEFTHRDGVRFSNGREILLQRLQPGQRVQVISLAPDDEPGTSSDRHPQHLNLFAVDRNRP
ncbi:MAG: hypothetical protein LAP40_18970 [Acidobacteriia bacterium]|nr:hypothetical protein [Terriglobia bacterium]